MNEYHKETLLITNDCFYKLHEEILKKFKGTHGALKIKDSQLYGFGNYNLSKPNLKKELESILKSYINGKYLYNKFRECVSGKPTIKLSGDYKYVLFKYIGYGGINEFIDEHLTGKQKELQYSILNQKSSNRDYYYVSYYFGEDKKLNKGTTIFYNNWKTVEMIDVYHEASGEKAEYKFHSNVIHSGAFVFLDTKFFLRHHKSEGARCVFFVGTSSPTERQFLKGTYSGFDKYDRAIAGVILLQKFDTLKDIESELGSKHFNPIIAQELNQKRFVVESGLIKDLRKLSKYSPFAKLLSTISGDYCIVFHIENRPHRLYIGILPYHLNINSANDSIIIVDDKIRLLGNGRILKLDFDIEGVFVLQSVSIYLDMLDLSSKTNKTNGSFHGMNINNNIVSGGVEFRPLE